MKTKETTDQMIKEICKIFYDLSDYTETAELTAAKEKVYSLYWNDKRFKDIMLKMEQAILDYETEAQIQGFTFGFKKALELLNDFNFNEYFYTMFNLYMTGYSKALAHKKKPSDTLKHQRNLHLSKKW